MLKVVVFDSGWGGELVADYLEKELGIVEIVRVIDWANAPYEGKSVEEIIKLASTHLHNYIGVADVIVLGGYMVSLCIDKLRKLYPRQKFVGLGINYDAILRGRNYPERVVVLMDNLLNISSIRQELRNKLLYSTIVLPDCSGWEDLINHDALTKQILKAELSWDFRIRDGMRRRVISRQRLKPSVKDKILIRAALENLERLSVAMKDEDVEYSCDDDSEKIKPNLILILNTHFWEIKAEIEELFGWDVRVLDFREKLLHDTCIALKLRGVHGKRSK